MITQIEIDGFKTFRDFKVELAPFQVIVGANGSGKSNLFDALHLLSRLAEVDIRVAFQEIRGDPHALFTLLPNGQRVPQMRLAVELMVDRKVQDGLGGEAELANTRLRYEIAMTQQTDERGLEQLYITHESLKSIPAYEDTWGRKHGVMSQDTALSFSNSKPTMFITTERITGAVLETSTSKSDHPEEMIHLSREGQKGRRVFSVKQFHNSVLSSAVSTDLPYAYAVRQEMRSWKFLNLDPKELRKPGSMNATPFLTREGANLPTMLVRMQTEDAFAMTGVSLDMANLVPGILNIKTEKNVAQAEYDVLAETDDGLSLSANNLSDGTLRLLALATLRNDAQLHGVLCLEEPENGVHPLHLKNTARLLREMATDFNNPLLAGQPMRQLLITTHSSAFISQPAVIDSLLLAFTVKRVGEIHITRMEPVVTPESQIEKVPARERTMEVYTIDTVKQYLQQDTLSEASSQLEKARMMTDVER